MWQAGYVGMSWPRQFGGRDAVAVEVDSVAARLVADGEPAAGAGQRGVPARHASAVEHAARLEVGQIRPRIRL